MKNKKINFNFKTFLKNVNWKLLLVISLITLIPTIYKTTRVYFIGQIDDGNSYSIVSQIQWLNILYEIITEAIIVPMFLVYQKRNKNFKTRILVKINSK